jgi:hypothetical protein
MQTYGHGVSSVALRTRRSGKSDLFVRIEATIPPRIALFSNRNIPGIDFNQLKFKGILTS